MLHRSAVVLIGCVAIGLWEALPVIVGRLVARADSLPDPPLGLRRLKIGHRMAGGGEEANVILADSLKSVVRSKLFGVSRTESRSAWRDLVAALGAAERAYVAPAKGFGLGPTEQADAEVAEGLRYVSHVVRLSLELYIESEPLESPRFVRFVSPHLKLLGDNPDAFYFISLISPAAAYLVSGCRSAEVYFSLSVHAEQRPGEAFQRVVADANDGALEFDARGCWQLVLSSAASAPADLPAGAAFLRLPADAATLVTRHYVETNPPAQLSKSAAEGIDLSIRRWRGAGLPADEPDARSADARMAGRLGAVSKFVADHTVSMPLPDPSTAPPFFSLVPNVIGPPMKWAREAQGMGAVDIAYGAGRFLLKPGEALLISGRMPPCRFANVVLWNRYLQSFDYTASETRPVSLNRAAMHLDGSGRFRLVLSERSPYADHAAAAAAHSNWLSTEGRPTGTVFFRFVLPSGEVEQPVARVVDAAAAVHE